MGQNSAMVGGAATTVFFDKEAFRTRCMSESILYVFDVVVDCVDYMFYLALHCVPKLHVSADQCQMPTLTYKQAQNVLLMNIHNERHLNLPSSRTLIGKGEINIG
jgi:hypothetical protein